jgi:hypothetical protein
MRRLALLRSKCGIACGSSGGFYAFDLMLLAPFPAH